ncbi:glr1516 [Gloeobacter violaceus PCC 7421]|uniref:Glr1516 protein n=2 Tax=Gloeobacter violaceus TaxID=33072 RepID=Q7NKG2_GLOVI|nr:glr1516 [Gloeobacter violaceus PCC 7421]
MSTAPAMNANFDSEAGIRAYYDQAPYPNYPLETTHADNADALYLHNLMTPYYLRNQRVVSGAGKRILDAGCGSGFTSLALAQANPGARIVGIDLSERSVAVARERLAFHGFKSAEFHALPIERVGELGEDFDLINCDEVLYLLPDPGVGLAALTGALAPDGILRANLHDRHQRAPLFRAQQAFALLNAVGKVEGEARYALVSDVMESLGDRVFLKQSCWGYAGEEHRYAEWIAMNYLLEGDKGFTIPELFAMLRQANLEFVCMLQWPEWELVNLFKEPTDLPPQFAQIYRSASPEVRLHLYELFHGNHRLIDFWCAHPGRGRPYRPPARWNAEELAAARVHLHPQLCTEQLKADLMASLAQNSDFQMNRYLRAPRGGEFTLDSLIARGLLPLWEGPQPLETLIESWVAAVCAQTAAAGGAIDPERLRGDLLNFVAYGERFAYFLVERTA